MNLILVNRLHVWFETRNFLTLWKGIYFGFAVRTIEKEGERIKVTLSFNKHLFGDSQVC